MKVITILTILACSTFVMCSRQYYVLTVFKKLQEYVLKMVHDPGLNPLHMLYNKDFSARYNLCKYLLAAPLFEMSSEVNPINRARTVDTGFHKIDSYAWIQLRHMCNEYSSFHNRTCNIASQKIKFPCYTCINHDSKFTWLVSFANSQYVGFLFTTVPANSIYALIDLTAKLTPMRRRNDSMYIEFLRSADIADPPHSEPLCNLKKISQFRICAICADSLHRKKHPTDNDSPYHRSEINRLQGGMYADPYFNYYNDTHYENNEHCPNQNVFVKRHQEVTRVVVSALYCHITMKETNHKFYIKRNSNEDGNKNTVFIIEEERITGETVINQLSNILTMDAYL